MTNEFKTDSSYIVMKGRFKAPAASAYGVYVIFMDNLNKTVDKIDLVSSHFSTIYENNNPNMPWNELQDIINRLKWKGEYATSLTHDIQASMEDLFQPNTGRGVDIWNALKKGQPNKAVAIFEEYLVRPTGDKAIKCELVIENVTKSDMEDVRRSREQKDQREALKATQNIQIPKAESDVRMEESSVVLEISLMLSPISGKPLMELKEGDKILVKISEQSSRGQYFLDLLNATANNEILPMPATVIKVSREGKINTCLVSIGPGIYGKSMDEDNVKVKLFDPTVDKAKIAMPGQRAAQAVNYTQDATMQRPAAGGGQKADGDNKNALFIVIGVVAILLVLVIVFMVL